MPSATTAWPGDEETKPAPGPLRRVQALINTLDRESGQDRLASAHDAAPWLATNDLLRSGTTPTTDELSLLVGVREGLRALVIDNAGGPTPDPLSMAPLRSVAAHAGVRADVTASGAVTLAPVGDTVRDRLVGLLLVVFDAQRDGTWAHLKACANDECRWAFYDRSRNHGGAWCDMAECGNKLKNREFRARRRRGSR